MTQKAGKSERTIRADRCLYGKECHKYKWKLVSFHEKCRSKCNISDVTILGKFINFRRIRRNSLAWKKNTEVENHLLAEQLQPYDPLLFFQHFIHTIQIRNSYRKYQQEYEEKHIEIPKSKWLNFFRNKQ